MTEGARLELDRVGKRFGRRRALTGVTLLVEPGDSVALLGANGAGKSTLLRVVAGLARPDAGRVLVDGRPPASDAATRLRTGYLGHATMLYDALSPRENLAFAARLFGVSEVRSRVDQLLRAMGLVDRADGPVHELSRGMQQRIALARALVHEPALLLLDEPHAGLDAAASDALGRILEAFGRRGRTLLLATHDVDRALALCRRVVVLDRGRVLVDRDAAGLDASLVAEECERAGRGEGARGWAEAS